MRLALNRHHIASVLTGVVALAAPCPAPAGTEIEAAPDKKVVAPPELPKPMGSLTLGAKFSDDISGVFLDSITPLWTPGDFLLFLDTRTTYEGSGQMLSSYGLGARYLLPDHNVIFGINAFYDSLDSRHRHHFDELGLGAEILTRWVDARFNYYLPDDSRYEVGRSQRTTDSSTRLGNTFFNQFQRNHIAIQQQKTTRERRVSTRRYEFALEGWNAEVGFLVPGLERYMETRLFVGAYGYGGDFTGVKARAEARPLPGVLLNVEYWEDSYLMGGNWSGELAVSVPFDIFNLARGRNPFDGFTDSFRPRQREFRERMSDMVLRSHRVMTDETTTSSGNNTSNTTTATEGEIILKPEVKKLGGAPPPPQVGQGEG